MTELLQLDILFLQSKVAYERDQRAYKQLFVHFHKALHQFAFSITGDREGAEEIVSDVMMKVWRQGEGLANVQNLQVYLFRAVKNTSLNFLASNSKHRSVALDNITITLNSECCHPEKHALYRELHGKIQAIVSSLPPKCQMVYKLVKEDGFSYKEVAEIMNVSVNTVDNHLFKAIKKITLSLKPYLQ
jgi:RNA polymerase sigma-70 factor (ECF subfamily)